MSETESAQTGGPASADITEVGVTRADQIYIFGALALSVGEARRILHQHPKATVQVSTVKWAANFGLTLPDPRIDREYALTRADITDPVLVANVETLHGPPIHVVFDGCHRLYRALLEARVSVPGYVFTADETRQIIAAGAFELAAHLDAGRLP